MLNIGRTILLDETIYFPSLPKPLIPGTQGTIKVLINKASGQAQAVREPY